MKAKKPTKKPKGKKPAAPPPKKKPAAPPPKKKAKVMAKKPEAEPRVLDIPSTYAILKAKTFPLEPTEELVIAICHLIRQGSTAETAARAMAIPRTIFRRWLEKGVLELEDPTSIYGKLVISIDAAEATDEHNDLLCITIGVKHWAALAWKRERKTPHRWGQRPTISLDLDTLTPGNNKPTISDEDAATIFTIIEQCGLVPAAAAPTLEESVS